MLAALVYDVPAAAGERGRGHVPQEQSKLSSTAQRATGHSMQGSTACSAAQRASESWKRIMWQPWWGLCPHVCVVKVFVTGHAVHAVQPTAACHTMPGAVAAAQRNTLIKEVQSGSPQRRPA